MSLKYLINLTVALAGGFLVVASRSFADSTVGWLALAVGALAVVLAGAGLAVASPNRRSLGYAVTGLAGLWTLIAGLVFSGSAQGWLVFADGLALVAVALVELTVHEVSTERVVHTIDVRQHSELQTV